MKHQTRNAWTRALLIVPSLLLLIAACGDQSKKVDDTSTDLAPNGHYQKIDGTPNWLTYARDAEYDAILQRKIEVPLRTEGDTLNCDMTRPGIDGVELAGPFPGIVYQYTGYAASRTLADQAGSAFLAERGYVVLQCSTKGVGGSVGKWDPFSPQEAQDNYDIIEWLAAQPYTSDRIGQTGTSYGAINTYRVAALNPPHLTTIVPQAAYSDLYQDLAHMGGTRGLDMFVWLFPGIFGLNIVGTPPDQLLKLKLRSFELAAEGVTHRTRDQYWIDRSINHDALRASGIPILGFGGWYDIFQRGMPRNHIMLSDQHWLVMDTSSHLEFTGPTFQNTVDGGVLAWFDYWLYDDDKAPLPNARVTSSEMPRGDDHRWYEFDTWPPKQAKAQRLYFNPSGPLSGSLNSTAGAESELTYVVDPTDGQPSFWNAPRTDMALIPEYNAIRSLLRATFKTEPLAQDTVLAGSLAVKLVAAVQAEDTNFVVRLFDESPLGSQTLVGTGRLKATHRHSSESPSPISNQFTDYHIEVWPSHWRFKAGHRMTISVSGGDVPRIFPDAPLGTVTLLGGPEGSTVDYSILNNPPVDE